MSKKDTRTVDFLKEASLYYKDICPEQGRYLMQQLQSVVGQKLPEEELCPFCFRLRDPDNHRVRLKPKRGCSRQVQRALWKEASRRPLNSQQLRVLRRFRNSSSTLMATCNACSKTSKRSGVSRDFVTTCSKSQYTPANSCKQKTPGKTPRSTSSEKTPGFISSQNTPSRTPRSTPSESSGRKPGREKTLSRLRKFLMPEDNQKSEKGGLRSFLSSL